MYKGKKHITDLRIFLTRHPLLVLELGFIPVLDPKETYGFDIQKTVPSDSWLRNKQRNLKGDVTYYRSLYQETVNTLNQFPINIAADAAFDAWYIYHSCALQGGIAALPLNQHGHPTFKRDTDGVSLCSKDKRMIPTKQFKHTNGYRAQRY